MESYKEKRASLIKQYEYAKRHNDYSKMAIIAAVLSDRTPEQEILFGQYLMANGKIEEARATFESINGRENDYFRLSGLSQIAFEQKNWALASKQFYELKTKFSYITPFLTAYIIYISKALQKDLPGLIIPPAKCDSEKYLIGQLDDFSLDRSIKFMINKVSAFPQIFDFKGADLEELLWSANTSLLEINDRGNQMNCFTELPMFFDKYFLANDELGIEVATVPFTTDIYAIKPMIKWPLNKTVYPLIKHSN